MSLEFEHADQITDHEHAASMGVTDPVLCRAKTEMGKPRAGAGVQYVRCTRCNMVLMQWQGVKHRNELVLHSDPGECIASLLDLAAGLDNGVLL